MRTAGLMMYLVVRLGIMLHCEHVWLLISTKEIIVRMEPLRVTRKEG